MKERLGSIKKRLIEEACPATIEELKKAGKFHTMGGLYNFLKRHNADITKLIIVKFPVGE